MSSENLKVNECGNYGHAVLDSWLKQRIIMYYLVLQVWL